MVKISNWEIYKTAGENGRRRGRRVHVKELQKAPFFVFRSQEPLEARHASATAAPSHSAPFLKPPSSPHRLLDVSAHSVAPLLKGSFMWPPTPQASPTVFLPRLDNGKKLNREVATIFLQLNEVAELSCTPKKEMTIALANELFYFLFVAAK